MTISFIKLINIDSFNLVSTVGEISCPTYRLPQMLLSLNHISHVTNKKNKVNTTSTNQN